MCLLPGTCIVVQVLLLAQGLASVVLVNYFSHSRIWLDALNPGGGGVLLSGLENSLYSERFHQLE